MSVTECSTIDNQAQNCVLPQDVSTHPQTRVLRLKINSVPVLAACCMGFLHNGGLFVPGLQGLELKQSVFMMLSLPDLVDGTAGRFGVLAKVAWITPVDADRLRTAGTGLHFEKPTDDLQLHIQALLNGMDSSMDELLSHTL